MFIGQLLVVCLLTLQKVQVANPLDNSLSQKGEKQLALDMLQSLPTVSLGQYNCSDVNPPNHSCQWVKQEGLCEVIRTQFCSLTCFTCCIDMEPPKYSCEDIVFLGICDHTITKGYCLKKCNVCQRLREIFSLTSLKLSIQYPNLLSTWAGWGICIYWKGVICKNGYVSELRLGYNYFNFQKQQWINSNPQILSKVATSIPAQLSGLEHLIGLYLGYTGITGKLPAELSVLNQLRVFTSYASFITGSLPPQYSAWSNLVVFDVQNNQVSGSIPKQFSTWRQTDQFLVQFNQLTGSIPKQFSTWRSTTQFWVVANQLRGRIPMQLSTWCAIASFSACINKGNKLCTPPSFKQFSTSCPFC